MDFETFKKTIRNAISGNTVLKNPGGGLSTIKSYHKERISYIRGKSVIYISYRIMYDTFQKFMGCEITSSELKKYEPKVFDSKKGGHSCNCTFFFMLLRRMGVVTTIKGRGVKGDPYYVNILQP